MYFCLRCCGTRPDPYCQRCIDAGRYAPRLPLIDSTPVNPMPPDEQGLFRWWLNQVQPVDQYGYPFDP